jgi:DNA-binding GntR family transcriptional regulator
MPNFQVGPAIRSSSTNRLRRRSVEPSPDGEAVPGQRLPPARDLAKVLGANADTVLRAMRQLRDEGLVEFRRGHGITVSGHAPARSAAIARLRDLVQYARVQGSQPDESIRIIQGVR